MREIEVKMKVADLEAFARKLAAKGVVLSEPISQRDVVYSKAGSTEEWEHSKEGDITMRIRHQDDGAKFTLKQQRSGGEMDNLEYETDVGSPEEMDAILRALGYVPQVEVKKVRRKGKLGKYEICLDEVEKLGTFIELEELTEDSADPEKVRNELFSVLESLGIPRSDEETRGYDTQMWHLLHGQKT